MFETTEMFDLTHTLAEPYLRAFRYPWEALDGIGDWIRSIEPDLPAHGYQQVAPHVWVHETAKVAPTAFLGAPCIIGAETEVRHCAFIRENALVGDRCVVGNSVELKNVIVFDDAQVCHFNYAGDSILGWHAHMGAGSVTSNVKLSQANIAVCIDGEKTDTGRWKFGAMIGDYVEIGCNAVLNPGTLIGPHSDIYPLSRVRGTIPPYSILKGEGSPVPKR